MYVMSLFIQQPTSKIIGIIKVYSGVWKITTAVKIATDLAETGTEKQPNTILEICRST
jgi:hypothetical protein